MVEEAAVTSTRQRRKRKWDQPAEAIVSAAATPGLSPLTTGAISGAGVLPGGFPSYLSYFQTMPTTALQPAAGQITPAAMVQQSAAAIVQKFNQDLASKGLLLQAKIQDELIAREITINDAEPGVRYKLTKRQTQEEIQQKTGAVVITRGRYRPPNGQVETEKPLYLHISAGVNLKDTAERIKAVEQAAAMVEDLLKQGQQIQLPVQSPPVGAGSNGNVPTPVTATIYVGLEADPSFNLIGRIRGPHDQYINHIMNETGATVVLGGRGSGNKEVPSGEELPQPLHLFISSDNSKSVDDAKTLADNLLETIRADHFSFRLQPYQLLPLGVSSVLPPSVISYPSTQQTLYQSSGAHLSPSLYRPYYPSVGGGGYPSSYTTAQAPCPSFPLAVVASPMDLPSIPDSSLKDSYVNISAKVYGAVPPPIQLLGDQSTKKTGEATQSLLEEKLHLMTREGCSQSSTTDSTLPAPTSWTLPRASSISTTHPQPSIHNPFRPPCVVTSQFMQHMSAAPPTPGCASQAPQTSAMLMAGQSVIPACSQAFGLNHVQASTTSSYGGYSGVYTEGSSLQQVTQALQRPPLPVSVKPLPNSAFLATLTKAQSSSFTEKHSDKQPAQRRKFQEYPVAGRDSSADDQLGRRRMVSCGPDASASSEDPVPPSSSKSMPPPPPSRSVPAKALRNIVPPKCFSSAAPARTASPPLMQQNVTLLPSVTAGLKQVDGHAARHGTGLKLVEYVGEDEEESSAGRASTSQSERFFNGKPFWAA